MYLESIKLKNFRNYSDLNIRFSPNINIIYGKNAQGKTNLLESIYFLAVTKSHHSFLDSKLIKNGQNYLITEGKIINQDTDTKYQIFIQEGKKTLKINDDIIKKVGDYISNINIIIFYPDDLELIKGNPQNRRRYLNVQLSQLSSKYFKVLNDYNKLLKIRNDYLKKYVDRIDFDEKYFDIITDHLIDKSVYIYKMRKKYIEKINEYCKNISKKIFNTINFKINYIYSFEKILNDDQNVKEKIIEEYKKSFLKEKKYRSTVLGPHKDELEFILDDNNIKFYGSQGQQRLAVLVFKLAEIEIFNDYKNTYPILLLDDVFSELDTVKKNNLLGYINNNMQTIITTTDLNNLDKNLINMSKLIKIVDGKLEEV